MVEKELKFYYAALLLGIIGALCILVFMVGHSMTTMMVIGFGMFLIMLGVLSLLYGIYADYKRTGSLRETFGVTDELIEAIGTIAKLTLIVIVAAAALAVTYEATQEQLKITSAGVESEIFSRVVSGATSFKAVMDESEEAIYYEAYDDAGNLVGYAFYSEIMGCQDVIKIAGGIDLDYRVTGVTIVRHLETPGLGAKIAEPEFQEQFRGVTIEELRLTKDDGKIDAITGATISSQAVVDAMRNKIEEIQRD
ncbi:MAG: FMN-binding protein [Methanocellales archaeon]|nr:FMN-binding protein [Methanocellales archaeon]